MARKLAAVPLPEDLTGRTVLDVGCDHGFWCALARDRGATEVRGLDRNRPVNGVHTDLVALNRAAVPGCDFSCIELGRQWFSFGKFDVVLMLSMYHHVYNLTGDHNPIWFWMYLHTQQEVLWENPVDLSDGVAAKDIVSRLHAGYTEAAIRAAAEMYFDIEVIGRGHVSTRTVWRCTPKKLPAVTYQGAPRDGAGGAALAFQHTDGRRIAEIESALGFRCVPGTLNIRLTEPFDWDRGYLTADVTEMVDRNNEKAGWKPRRCRFYPVTANGEPAVAMRFENEKYRDTLLELISNQKLRDVLRLGNNDTVAIACA
jgi:SAM-dependent methyltransferase